MLVSQPIANEWPIKPPFDNRQVLLATSSSQLALTKVGISDPSKINNHLQETTNILDLLSGKNDEKHRVHEKQNFPALRDENCNREEPVQKPSRIFSWRSGHQPERSFFSRTRFRIPCSVRLTGILRTDTDKTDMVRLSVCPTDVPKYIYQGVPMKDSKKSTSNTLLTLKRV